MITEAEKLRIEAKLAIETAAKDISNILLNKPSGYSLYKPELIERLNKAVFNLIQIRESI